MINGYQFKILRESMGLTRAKLAEYVQVSVKTIKRFEEGQNVRRDTAALLAEFYGVTIGHITGELSYIESRKEENKLHIWDNMELYKIYLKTRNINEIDKSKIYYKIINISGRYSGTTMWVGFEDKEYTKEIRKLRPIDPEKNYSTSKKIYGKPVIINNVDEAIVFEEYDVAAYISKDVCEICYPDLIIWHNCQNCERELKGSIFDCPLIEQDNNVS